MNWGHKILLVYIVFVAGIMFLVFKSSSQKMDLVTTDYYAKELKYQQKIDAMNKVNQLSGAVKYEMKEDRLTIVFPKDFAGKKITGDVLLYCPSNEDKDVTQNFSVQDNSVLVPVSINSKGLYELQLTWQAGETSYYFEKKLVIN